MADIRPVPTLPRRAPSADGPTFRELGVPAPLCDTLGGLGLERAFPIQAATLSDALAGRDVLGRGRTGSGKTLAFALPLIARLADDGGGAAPRRPRALVLAPTRELARQIDATLQPLAAALGLRTTTVFGGVAPRPQITALRRGVDIVVACPGRLEDHLRSGAVSLEAVQITVLDEADHMADLGFLPVVDRLLARTPARGQRLLFSATLDGAVDALVARYLHDPVVHSVDDGTPAADAMDHHVMHVSAADRLPVLVGLTASGCRSVVFTRTKHRARQLARKLVAEGVSAVELHGDLSQNVRSRNLASFSHGRATALVATDIAARGIHVDGVELVIHADPPLEHKAYLHRSGRTARAGARGTVVTLATAEQQAAVRNLGRRAGITATVTRVAPGHPLIGELAPGVPVLRPRPTADTGGSADHGGAVPRRPRRRGGQDRPDGAPRRDAPVRGTAGGSRGRGAPGTHRPGGVEDGPGEHRPARESSRPRRRAGSARPSGPTGTRAGGSKGTRGRSSGGGRPSTGGRGGRGGARASGGGGGGRAGGATTSGGRRGRGAGSGGHRPR